MNSRAGLPVPVGTVVSFGLTAIKGGAHSHPNRIVVRRQEVLGDRRWALIEAIGQGFRIVRTVDVPAMLRVRGARDPRGGLRLDLPDGRVFLVSTPDGPVLAVDYWGRQTPVRPVPGPWDAAVSELLGRDVQLVAVDRAGGAVYAEPISLVSSSSLQELARRAGVSQLDDERFRSTVVVQTPDLPAFSEDGWVGRGVRVGAVELLVRRRLARCGVIRFEPGTGRANGPDLLRLLATDRTAATGIVFGVGADVVAPGELTVGDPVAIWASATSIRRDAPGPAVI